MGVLDFFRWADPSYKGAPRYDGDGVTVADLVTNADLDSLRADVADLRRRVAVLEGRRHPDGVRWYNPDGGDARPDLASWTGQALPFVSTLARISGELTSTSFAKQTWGDAGLFTVIGGLVGAGVALGAELPWTLAPAGAAVAFCLSGATLVLHRRALLGRVVKAQADKSKRRGEMVIKVDRTADEAGAASFLYVKCDISPDQIKEFARRALAGESLAVHRWCGVGGCFTRSQFDSLAGELVLMGYMRPAGGNVARSLTRKGEALMRAVVNP